MWELFRKAFRKCQKTQPSSPTTVKYVGSLWNKKKGGGAQLFPLVGLSSKQILNTTGPKREMESMNNTERRRPSRVGVQLSSGIFSWQVQGPELHHIKKMTASFSIHGFNIMGQLHPACERAGAERTCPFFFLYLIFQYNVEHLLTRTTFMC